MKPVIIHSYLGNRTGTSLTPELLQNVATCSFFFAKKAGFKIVLYTDNIGKKLLKNIKYDEIIMFDEKIIDQLPKSVWSAGKILAAATETRPFIHIDFDFFIFDRKFYYEILNKNFFTFYEEPWIKGVGKNKNSYEDGIKIISEVLKNDLDYLKADNNLVSANFSIFGSCIAKKIPIINKVCKNMINTIIKHKDFLNSTDILDQLEINFENYGPVMIPVIIEQILLLNMIKNALGSYHTLIKIQSLDDMSVEGSKIGLIHLHDIKIHESVSLFVKELYKKIINP